MLAILGGGLTVVMITGRIDLSIGYGTSLLGIFCAALMVDFGISMPVAVLLTLLGGALIGLLNGTLMAVFLILFARWVRAFYCPELTKHIQRAIRFPVCRTALMLSET